MLIDSTIPICAPISTQTHTAYHDTPSFVYYSIVIEVDCTIIPELKNEMPIVCFYLLPILSMVVERQEGLDGRSEVHIQEYQHPNDGWRARG